MAFEEITPTCPAPGRKTTVQIPVLVEPVANNGYRARSGEPLACSAEGETSHDAIRNLQALLDQRFTPGTSLIQLNVPSTENPWVEYAGMFKDDPWIDDWVQSMADFRQQVEDDPNR